VVRQAPQGGRDPDRDVARPAPPAATLELTEGVRVHIVAARHGDDPKTVLDTHAHLLPSSDEVAAERVAAVIS
jgi:hypothetical protein